MRTPEALWTEWKEARRADFSDLTEPEVAALFAALTERYHAGELTEEGMYLACMARVRDFRDAKKPNGGVALTRAEERLRARIARDDKRLRRRKRRLILGILLSGILLCVLLGGAAMYAARGTTVQPVLGGSFGIQVIEQTPQMLGTQEPPQISADEATDAGNEIAAGDADTVSNMGVTEKPDSVPEEVPVTDGMEEEPFASSNALLLQGVLADAKQTNGNVPLLPQADVTALQVAGGFETHGKVILCADAWRMEIYAEETTVSVAVETDAADGKVPIVSEKVQVESTHGKLIWDKIQTTYVLYHEGYTYVVSTPSEELFLALAPGAVG